MSFYFSLTRWTLFNATFIGLDNYVLFLGDPMLMSGLRNTIIYAVLTSGLKVIIGLPLAMLLTSASGPRASAQRRLLSGAGQHGGRRDYLQRAHAAVRRADQHGSGLLRAADSRTGWAIRSLALYSVALVDVWKGLGLATVIFIAGIMSIPQEYFEAAQLEGGTG